MTKTAKINIDDGILIQQWQQGKSAAMEQLVLKYQGRIYNVILKICGNPEDAAELAQETFVKVIENIDKFQQRSSFYTWAFRIAVNLTLNYCKRNVKLGFKSLEADEQNKQGRMQLKEFLADDKSPDPAIAAQNKEMCQLVTKAIMKLDDSQRAVIVLRDIDGMSYSQIAGVLDIELGTVKSRISRARSSLREILEGIL